MKQPFSVALLGLQNLFASALAGCSTTRKCTFAPRPKSVLEPRLHQVHLWDWTLGWLPQGFCPLSAESSAESVKQFRAHSTAAAFLHRFTKGNHKLDYLVFAAFDTDSWLIQNLVHCFLSIYYPNTSTEFYTETFSSYCLQILLQKYFSNLIRQESPSACFIWKALQSFDHYKISRWYQWGSWSTPS